MDDSKTVPVGIGELFVTKDHSLILVAYGLGSCVGVSAYDPVTGAGGLAHVMLPNSKETSTKAPGNRFADIAIPTLIRELKRLGATDKNVVFKVVGGAQMLGMAGKANAFRIGERNVEAVTEILKQHRIEPKAMDTGGCQGRTMRLFMDTGRVLLKIVGRGDVEI
ncbi:MAG: chemotaxis protein CheD [Chloroflexi bacterium]|nr:chemotaxis protein CheD [Chloroflexota bacterium]